MILITGAAGFIGSHFARLKAKTDKIIIIDKLTYAGNLDNIRDLLTSVQFIQGDIADFDLIKHIVEQNKVKTIVNFAAESHVDRAIEGPLDFTKTNVFGTHVLLEVARLHNLRFHQVSTDEVYGDIAINKRSIESDPLYPRSPYSASKAAADLLAYSYHITYGLFVTISRGANTIGSFQHPEKALALFATNALLDLPLPLYGDGLQTREYTDVRDHCSAIELILQHGKAGNIYNVGVSEGLNNLEMAKIILKELEKPESLIRFVQDRPGHDRRYAMDTKKIGNLGWKPQVNAREAVKNAAHWYKENENWWRKIRENDIFRQDYLMRYAERLK